MTNHPNRSKIDFKRREQKLWDEINMLDELIVDLRSRRNEKLSRIRGYKASETKKQNSVALGYDVESEAGRKAAATRLANKDS